MSHAQAHLLHTPRVKQVPGFALETRVLGQCYSLRLPALAGSGQKEDREAPLYLFLKFFLHVYLFLRQRETEHEWRRGEREETQNPKQAPGSELSAHRARREARTHEL